MLPNPVALAAGFLSPFSREEALNAKGLPSVAGAGALADGAGVFASSLLVELVAPNLNPV